MLLYCWYYKNFSVVWYLASNGGHFFKASKEKGQITVTSEKKAVFSTDYFNHANFLCSLLKEVKTRENKRVKTSAINLFATSEPPKYSNFPICFFEILFTFCFLLDFLRHVLKSGAADSFDNLPYF